MPKRTARFGAKRVVKRLRRKYGSRARTTTPIYRYIRRRPTSNTAAFSGAGFPRHLTMKHKWVYTHEYPITNLMTGARVGCLSLFAPSTLTARQPMFFDQMTPIYNRYNVIGAKIKWTVVPALSVAEQGIKCVAWVNENNINTVTFDDLVEYKGANVKYSQGGINPDRMIFYSKWSTKKHNPGSTMANTELYGTAIANPLEQPQFQLNFQKISVTTPAVAYFITAEVSYIAVWSELKEIAGS